MAAKIQRTTLLPVITLCAAFGLGGQILLSQELPAEQRDLLDAVERAGKYDYEARLKLFEELQRLDPYNVEYAKEATFYRDSLELQQRKRRSSAPAQNPRKEVNPKALTAGQSYIVSRVTPIMPQRSVSNPSELVAATARVVRLQPGQSFTVLRVDSSEREPWYVVKVETPQGQLDVLGWINSIALIGQTIRQKP